METGSSRSAGGFYGQLKAKALSQCGETMRGCKSLRSLRSSQGALLEQLSSGLGGPAECRSLLYIHSTFKNSPRTSLANQGVCWVKGEEVCLRGTLEPLQLPCNLKQEGRRLEWQVERCHKAGMRKVVRGWQRLEQKDAGQLRLQEGESAPGSLPRGTILPSSKSSLPKMAGMLPSTSSLPRFGKAPED